MCSSAHWFQPITEEVRAGTWRQEWKPRPRGTVPTGSLSWTRSPAPGWISHSGLGPLTSTSNSDCFTDMATGQHYLVKSSAEVPPSQVTLGLYQVDTWCFFSSGECFYSSLEHSSWVFSSYPAKLKSALCCVGRLFRFSGWLKSFGSRFFGYY